MNLSGWGGNGYETEWGGLIKAGRHRQKNLKKNKEQSDRINVPRDEKRKNRKKRGLRDPGLG